MSGTPEPPLTTADRDLPPTAAGRDLPLTAAGRAAVDRHREALAAYADNPAEWRAAYPAMVSAIIEAYTWRQSQPARQVPACRCRPEAAQGIFAV